MAHAPYQQTKTYDDHATDWQAEALATLRAELDSTTAALEATQRQSAHVSEHEADVEAEVGAGCQRIASHHIRVVQQKSWAG
jgi:hypothetical protein